MNYSESINYINEIPWTMRNPGLHRIKEGGRWDDGKVGKC